MKMCSRCKIEKPDTEFNFRYPDKGILQHSCKVCTREQSKKHYNNNVAEYVQRAEDRRKQMAIQLEQFKQTLVCSRCGENDHVCLDFHHVDPTKKDINVSKLTTCGSWKRIMKEIDKCVVVCANCHRKIHAHDS
jgi:hypothetical protein